jgi:metal transporter CNNM
VVSKPDRGVIVEVYIWILIAICVSQSAMFSGLNLALFSLPKLRLEVELAKNNHQAFAIASLREDSNFLLATILWGNVGVNVLLTILSGSVLTGVLAFFFSTFVITICGEIMPQAYFSRNAMRMASLLAPLIRFYQILLFPIAKPTAIILNRWLGKEAIQYVSEEDLIALIELQKGKEAETNIPESERQGIINFLDLKNVELADLGVTIDPESIVRLKSRNGQIVIPEVTANQDDEFVKKVNASLREWIILVDEQDEPYHVLNSNLFRAELSKGKSFDPIDLCHSPLTFKSGKTSFLEGLTSLRNTSARAILVWEREEKRIITNREALRLILKGISD